MRVASHLPVRILRHKIWKRIDKLDGEFVVLDRMPGKWKDRIDIHMESIAEARRLGKQRVKLSWKDDV